LPCLDRPFEAALSSGKLLVDRPSESGGCFLEEMIAILKGGRG
jgi:hypothetical protein